MEGPKPRGNNLGKILAHWVEVRRSHEQQADASLAERCERLTAEGNVRMSRTTTSRVLWQLELTRKKTFRAAEGDTIEGQQARTAYQKMVAAAIAEELIFVDETSARIDPAWLHVWAPQC